MATVWNICEFYNICKPLLSPLSSHWVYSSEWAELGFRTTTTNSFNKSVLLVCGRDPTQVRRYSGLTCSLWSLENQGCRGWGPRGVNIRGSDQKWHPSLLLSCVSQDQSHIPVEWKGSWHGVFHASGGEETGGENESYLSGFRTAFIHSFMLLQSLF